MPARFLIEGFSTVRDRRYVVARRTNGIPFVLVEGTLLGGVPIVPPVSQPSTMKGGGPAGPDLFSFCLAEDADAARLMIGDSVELYSPGLTHCRRCEASWALPSTLPDEVKAEVSAQQSKAHAAQALRPYCADLGTAKVIAAHLSPDSSRCHRCGRGLPAGEEVECPNCVSFNYKWLQWRAGRWRIPYTVTASARWASSGESRLAVREPRR